MSEEKIKKVPVNQEEIADDELDQVAGGYSAETWLKMTVEERRMEVIKSAKAQQVNEYCAMNDPTL